MVAVKPLQQAQEFFWARDFAKATRQCQQVLLNRPDCAEAWHLLGLVASRQGENNQALSYLEQALALEAANAETHKNLGAVLGQLGRLAEALDHLQQALALDPNCVAAHYNLGVTYEKLAQFDQARLSYQQVLRLHPNHPEAINNLGILSLNQGDAATAVEHFKQALALSPHFAPAHYYLASHYQYQGDLEQADYHFSQAIHLAPDQILWRLERDLLCPTLMPSRTAVEAWRQRVDHAIVEYPPSSIELERWLPQIYGGSNVFPPFEFAYHARSERLFRERLARIFKVAPAAGPVSRIDHPSSQKRLGFLVTRGHEKGLTLFLAGIINHLSDAFVVTVIAPKISLQEIQPFITRAKVSYLGLLGHLTTDVQQIRAAGLDLLYFWEVGTDAANYLLPFFRLAPVQVTGWGNPTTTGVPQVDYFLSSRWFEPAQAESHYSERLVKLNSLGVYFHRPAGLAGQRADFGFSEADHLYLCTQNLKKFHPDFDNLLGAILRQDPHGKVLLKAKTAPLNEALLQRFQTTLPDVADRIVWIPPQPYSAYLGLIQTADVLLDTVHYSGGTTSFEAIAVGTPIVTWPGEFMRGRMTYGCYQKIGVLDTVVWSAAEYVAKAVQLATDRAYQQHLRRKILAASPTLFEDKAAVLELEQFFARAIENAPEASI